MCFLFFFRSHNFLIHLDLDTDCHEDDYQPNLAPRLANLVQVISYSVAFRAADSWELALQFMPLGVFWWLVGWMIPAKELVVLKGSMLGGNPMKSIICTWIVLNVHMNHNYICIYCPRAIRYCLTMPILCVMFLPLLLSL